jgi:hypothetical protein
LRHSTTSSCEGESVAERFTSAFSGITPQSIRKRFSFNNRSKSNKAPTISNQDVSAETDAATSHQELKKKMSNNQQEKENVFESSAPVTVFVVTPDGDAGTIAFTPRADTRCLTEVTQPDSLSVKSGAHIFFSRIVFHPVALTTCDKSNFYYLRDVF